jgi:hypothetical protein
MKQKTFYEKLVWVQTELKAPKNQRNNFGKYNYRSCEDILEAVKPLLAESGLVLTISDTIEETNGYSYVNACVSIADGISSYSSYAQAGIDFNRKGMDIAQSFGSSSSYARKYALNGLFLIDDTKDADATNNHDKQTSNKIELKPDSVEFKKAKDFIKGGGSVEAIEKKYKLSNEVKQLLNK